MIFVLIMILIVITIITIIIFIVIIIFIIILIINKQSDVPPSNPGSLLLPINLGLLPNWGILPACQRKKV